MGLSGFSPSHILIVLLVVALLFGARRLPEAAKGMGRSLREFKAGLGDKAAEAVPATPATAERTDGGKDTAAEGVAPTEGAAQPTEPKQPTPEEHEANMAALAAQWTRKPDQPA